MLHLPKVSEIRWGKLVFHFIVVVIVLHLLILFGKDVVGWTVGHPIKQDVSYVSSTLCTVWLVFAVFSEKYRKS